MSSRTARAAILLAALTAAAAEPVFSYGGHGKGGTLIDAEQLAAAVRHLCLFGLSGISADVARALTDSKAKLLSLWWRHWS